MHTPVPQEAILDSLEALFDLLREEPQACVRAVLGHHLFVFIHPYFDGNGRIGRLLMNTLLASGGYPWTVIQVGRRDVYMKALEAASVHGKDYAVGRVHRPGNGTMVPQARGTVERDVSLFI